MVEIRDSRCVMRDRDRDTGDDDGEDVKRQKARRGAEGHLKWVVEWEWVDS